MKPRLNAYQVAPDTMKALGALEAQVQGSGLEKSLIELVKTRASQINGCAFCINMHTQDARKHGETELRLYLLNAWREAPVYTDRERAALAWTEAVTWISETHAPDDVYEEVRKQFSEAQVTSIDKIVYWSDYQAQVLFSMRVQPSTGSSTRSQVQGIAQLLSQHHQILVCSYVQRTAGEY